LLPGISQFAIKHIRASTQRPGQSLQVGRARQGLATNPIVSRLGTDGIPAMPRYKIRKLRRAFTQTRGLQRSPQSPTEFRLFALHVGKARVDIVLVNQLLIYLLINL
jgi:hypothetical protein